MPTQHTLLTFALVSVVITIIPGPSTLFILTRGIAHGRRGAIAAMRGIEIASAIRVLATAAGLSALVASSAIAFDALRWAGAIYLLHLGIRSLRSVPSRESPDAAGTSVAPMAGSTRQGILVGLANPKMAMFFLAFFPPFIGPDRGSSAEQILILGAVFWIIGVIWDLGIACFSGSVGARLHQRPGINVAKSLVEGITYFALGTWAAIGGA